MKKRVVALMLASLLLLLAGCSGGGEESSSTALNVVVAATYVDDSMLEGLKTELSTLTDYPDITVSAVATGDSQADPMGTMAGMAKLSGMMAAGEVDVFITDADNARRYGDNGEAYIALAVCSPGRSWPRSPRRQPACPCWTMKARKPAKPARPAALF